MILPNLIRFISAYQVPDIVLGARDSSVNKTAKVHALGEFMF